MSKSIIQDWVADLGLRQQGVLMAAVRGCDTISKEHSVKDISRCFRGVVLNAHCGPGKIPVSFMIFPNNDDWEAMVDGFEFDDLPTHFTLHLLHAAQIVGVYHPDIETCCRWDRFYRKIVRKMHLIPEPVAELETRLNANEDDFKILQNGGRLISVETSTR